MEYTVKPGLYALGEPGKKSEVVISANYALSFNILRKALKNMNAWILVLDTKGINVWCAAGKGTFGTEELAKHILKHRLDLAVDHRRVIVPQLGAPGVDAAQVKRLTGFSVHYGPVRADDLPGYINAGLKATESMRKVKFLLADRAVLTPLEIIPAFKKTLILFIAGFAFFGLNSEGVIFQQAWETGAPIIALGLISLVAGSVITPLLLPWIPFASFALKGLIAGLIMELLAIYMIGYQNIHVLLLVFALLLFPVFSSFLALQFTGASTYTGISGVKKELRYALPGYRFSVVVSCVLLLVYKFITW